RSIEPGDPSGIGTRKVISHYVDLVEFALKHGEHDVLRGRRVVVRWISRGRHRQRFRDWKPAESRAQIIDEVRELIEIGRWQRLPVEIHSIITVGANIVGNCVYKGATIRGGGRALKTGLASST